MHEFELTWLFIFKFIGTQAHKRLVVCGLRINKGFKHYQQSFNWIEVEFWTLVVDINFSIYINFRRKLMVPKRGYGAQNLILRLKKRGYLTFEPFFVFSVNL